MQDEVVALQQQIELLRLARTADADIETLAHLEQDLEKAQAAVFDAWVQLG